MSNEEIAKNIVAHFLKDKKNDLINELGMLEVRIGEALDSKDAERDALQNKVIELDAKLMEAVKAIILILPLAKGYAYKNPPIISNKVCIEAAEKVLNDSLNQEGK